MDDYLSKPVQKAELIRVLDAAKAIKRDAVTSGTAPGRDEPVFDSALALERVDGEREFLGEIVRLFLADAPGRLAEIRVERPGASLPERPKSWPNAAHGRCEGATGCSLGRPSVLQWPLCSWNRSPPKASCPVPEEPSPCSSRIWPS